MGTRWDGLRPSRLPVIDDVTRTDARHTHGHASGPLNHFRLRVASVTSGLGGLGFPAAALFNRPGGFKGTYNETVLPVLAVLSAGTFVALQVRPSWLERLALITLSAIATHFLAKLAWHCFS